MRLRPKLPRGQIKTKNKQHKFVACLVIKESINITSYFLPCIKGKDKLSKTNSLLVIKEILDSTKLLVISVT